MFPTDSLPRLTVPCKTNFGKIALKLSSGCTCTTGHHKSKKNTAHTIPKLSDHDETLVFSLVGVVDRKRHRWT
jgi:hypothetical protein